MGFGFANEGWIKRASEDELRSVEDQMRESLNDMDYDSDEYLQLDLKRIDIVNEISSRTSYNMPHREHCWYLSNDD